MFGAVAPWKVARRPASGESGSGRRLAVRPTAGGVARPRLVRSELGWAEGVIRRAREIRAAGHYGKLEWSEALCHQVCQRSELGGAAS